MPPNYPLAQPMRLIFQAQKMPRLARQVRSGFLLRQSDLGIPDKRY